MADAVSFARAGQRAARDSLPELTDQRLSKQSLLRKGWEFEKVYSRGKRLHGNGYTLICLENGSSDSRIGISVHRKIRGSVRRNRIKRIIRESFRLDRRQYPQGYDIVFAVRPDFPCKHPGDVCDAVKLLTAGITCG